uniref:Peptidase M1 membrane alanine aminopeptidase domain-containing protein n=1 Tax=Zea mays TaxID=4577 RepID=A0A804PYH8_MAIZE
MESLLISSSMNLHVVTYRETTLLFDEMHSAAANKQRVAVVVAHELAHQWFGNFVTMEWWTHMWLNEGFATWVSYLAADQFFPEWNVWTQFLEESTIGFKLDALAGSHPIEAANIITLYDVSSIWRIPLLLHEQKAHEAILKVLNLERMDKRLMRL